MAELNVSLEHGLHLSFSSATLTCGLLLVVCVKGLQFIRKSDLQHVLNMKVSSRALITVFVSLLCFTLTQLTLHSAFLKGRSSLSITCLSDSGVNPPDSQDAQSLRMQQLKKVCANRNKLISKDISRLRNTLLHLLVDDRHKVLYCYVPKTGCSLWKGLLMNMSRNAGSRGVPGDVHSMKKLNSYGIRELKTYPLEQILYRLKTYYKFLFVRHPFTRMVSAFRDKFTGKHDAFFAYLPKMLNYTRKLNRTIFANQTQKYNFTFTEFLQYNFESPDFSFKFNEHWNNLESICSPCFINYDYIGKQETFNEDTRKILINVFKRNMTEFGVPNWTGSDKRKAKSYFREVPVWLKMKAIQYYSRDAEMFGYDLQDY